MPLRMQRFYPSCHTSPDDILGWTLKSSPTPEGEHGRMHWLHELSFRFCSRDCKRESQKWWGSIWWKIPCSQQLLPRHSPGTEDGKEGAAISAEKEEEIRPSSYGYRGPFRRDERLAWKEETPTTAEWFGTKRTEFAGPGPSALGRTLFIVCENFPPIKGIIHDMDGAILKWRHEWRLVFSYVCSDFFEGCNVSIKKPITHSA